VDPSNFVTELLTRVKLGYSVDIQWHRRNSSKIKPSTAPRSGKNFLVESLNNSTLDPVQGGRELKVINVKTGRELNGSILYPKIQW
jgi:hypothetical protein